MDGNASRRDCELLRRAGSSHGDFVGADLGGQLARLAVMRRLLRSQRKRGVTGYWTYDLARHEQMLAAYRRLVWGVLDRQKRKARRVKPLGRAENDPG